MKIAFVHNRYIDYRIPFFKLISEKFNIKFFFEKEKEFNKKEIQLSFSRTIKLPAKNIRFSPLLPFKLLCGDFDLFISGELGYTNTIITFIVARLLRKPFIIWSEEWHPDTSVFRDLFGLKRKIVTLASACIAPGFKSASFLKFLGAKDASIFIAPNASIPILDLRQNHPSTFINSEFENAITKILYLGRLIQSKGIDYLIKSFALIEKNGHNAFLIIAGQGPYLTDLEKLAEEQNIKNILFTRQHVSDVDKLSLYKNCDIFVLPSVYYTYVEGWGLVLNEAMYFAKPVIATDMVGAAHDLIKNGTNGFIVPQRNVTALTNALITLMRDHKRKKKMGLNSKRIIQQGFQWSHMINGFVKAINYVFKIN
jgi:glycosyltransferase involved in cell wall biosynthesis